MAIFPRPFSLLRVGFVASALVIGILVPSLAHAATAEVWWPTAGAAVSGTQPFKAIVKDRALGDYDMFWQVDGGGLVKMDDSQTDYPHKEAQVDLAGWTWNPTATYRVTFVAKDRQGAEIARTDVQIKNSAQQVQQVAQATQSAPAPVAAPVVVTPIVAIAPAPAPTVTTVVTAPVQTVTTVTKVARITSPKTGSRLSGVQTLTAQVDGLQQSDYRMFWSVDNGGETELANAKSGTGKETQIDFSTWTWKGVGPYVIKVTSKNQSGAAIAKPVSVLVYRAQTATTAPAPAPTTTAVTAPTPVVTAPAAAVTAPSTSGSKLYVDPNNPALAQANAWRSSRPTDAAIMDKLGAQSSGIWLGGWNADVQSDVANAVKAATAQDASAIFVAYNIPGRDCGQYSAGGLSGRDAYLAWVKKIATGIGSGKAIVILEPDALALTDCLSDAGKADRSAMISEAVSILSANAGTKVYLDAGHSGWVSSSDMAARLTKAGVAKAAGFALNTSNYVTTADNEAYGEAVSKLVGGKHFVVDTSRNGSGSNGEWCNPSGRSLGQKPTLSTGKSLVDAYLWVKKPGESDGNCNGGPSAGSWWPEYALDLAKRAGY